jgi:hypothetical protein
MTLPFRFVCATRATTEGFGQTALGQSLSKFQYPGTSVRLFPENSLGLSTVYNTAIREAVNDPAILLFAHDDIFLCDFFWPAHTLSSLGQFDIVGVAGNRRRVPKQPTWVNTDEYFSWDEPENLSGIVGHGQGFPPTSINAYGAPGVEVKLLDGLLLIARSETLVKTALFFDERFDFHFYDLDFCRQAESKGVRMGTSYISVVHQSGGGYSSPAWRSGYKTYLQKWGS